MEAAECGAACLGMVLAHFGRWVALDELRLACGVSRNGTRASNIVKAAERYGLVVRPLARMEPEDLRHIAPPAILHWTFSHFVVFGGFHRGRILINDPANGHRSITPEMLDQGFTGVALTFETGPRFVRGGDAPSVVRAIRPHLAGAAWAILLVVLTGLILVAPGVATPMFNRVFIDRVLVGGQLDVMPPLLLLMGGAAIGLAAVTWLQQTALLSLETRIAVAGSARFLWHVLRLPMGFYTQRMAGDVSSRVAINDRVAQILSRDVASTCVAMLMLVFFGAIMFQYDRWLTLIGVAVASLNIVLLRMVSGRRADANRRLSLDWGRLHGVVVGGLRAIETFKANADEDGLFARWAGHHAKVANGRRELERHTQWLNTIPPLLVALNMAAILGVGSLRVMEGTFTLGTLIAFQILAAAFLAPVQRLVSLAGQFQLVDSDVSRLQDVLRYPLAPGLEGAPDDPDDHDAAPSEKLAGRLELRQVTFGYSPLELPLIEAIDLTLPRGQRIAIVGRSGSGKSTLARLVSGLYEPWSGEVRYDGLRRQDLRRATLIQSVAAVDQTILLFEGTVRDNITLWNPSIQREDMVAAARDALIHDDIMARPGGYDGVVAARGVNFSGGQRQRLEIARALATRPALLVLDEATSALDAETEHGLDENLRRRGCTCLIVAHRLSTIRVADEIIVLEHGRIVQRGTHHELLGNRDGVYSRLVSSFS